MYQHGQNRILLFEVMESTGFVNYPHEWWHVSHGDRYWAYAQDEAATIYAPAKLELVAGG